MARAIHDASLSIQTAEVIGPWPLSGATCMHLTGTLESTVKNRHSMKDVHQTTSAPWRWPLRGATLLPAADEGRWLRVRAGNVWLTRSEGEAGLSDDVWLAAGQRQRLPAGSEWVIEAWPEAQLELLLAPPSAAGRVGALSAAGGDPRRARHRGWLRDLRGVLQGFRQRLQPSPRRASALA
jgi:hypothetical protein